jgi:hypothetical protein
MFASLDLSLDACREVRQGGLPEPLRHLILREFGTS